MNQLLEPIDLPLVSAGQTGHTIDIPEGDSQITRSVLPGGVRVITQSIPGSRSVSLGSWFAVGSRDEADGHFGSTHFLEHLLFKGTRKRTALDIAKAFDKVGGESNAVTAKEYTSYYVRVLGADLPMAVETLMDMVTASELEETAFELERTVILDELAMAADDVTSVAHEAYAGAVFPGQHLGRPVGGTAATVGQTPRDSVWNHYRHHYHSRNLVVSAAGDVRHDQLCEMVMNALLEAGWDTTSAAIPFRREGAEELVIATPKTLDLQRPGEQAHLLMGSRSLPARSRRRPVMAVLLTILGGGMSSRLFQEVRENRGLAYTTYAYDSTYTDAGIFGIYAGCAPENLAEVERVARGEWEDMAAGNVTAEEVMDAQGQLRGAVTLGMEDNVSRMSRLGRSEVIQGRFTTVDAYLAQINAVTAEQVAQLAAEILERPQAKVTVTPSA